MSNLLEQGAQPQPQNTTTFIYALIDPRDWYVRYVGKSSKPRARFRNHLHPSKLKIETHKAHWLRELLGAGFVPIQEILEEVSKEHWMSAEKKWIEHYRSIPGYPTLTNSTDGGEGTDGYRFSEEQRKKLSNPKTWKERLRFSLGQTRRWAKASQEERSKMLSNLRTPWPEEKRKKRSQDARSAKRPEIASSQYRNVVRLNKARGEKVWRASCIMNGKNRVIGLFYTEIQAAQARDRFVLEHIGKDVPLNFPLSFYEQNPIAPAPDGRKRHSKTPKNNTLGYRGIHKNGKNGWAASINYMNVSYHLGTHRTPEQAALAYDAKALELYGDMAKLNFPRPAIPPPQ